MANYREKTKKKKDGFEHSNPKEKWSWIPKEYPNKDAFTTDQCPKWQGIGARIYYVALGNSLQAEGQLDHIDE